MKKIINSEELPIGLVIICILGLLIYALVLLASDISDYMSKRQTDNQVIDTPALNTNLNANTSQTVAFNHSKTDSQKVSNTTPPTDRVSTEVITTSTKVVDSEAIDSIKNIKTDTTVVDNLYVDTQASNTQVKADVKSKSQLVIADGVQWLRQQPRENYSLQLASFRDRAVLLNYVRSMSKLKVDDLRQLESTDGWFYLLYGNYASWQAAQDVKNTVQGLENVWVRQLGTLRDNRCRKLKLPPTSPAC